MHVYYSKKAAIIDSTELEYKRRSTFLAEFQLEAAEAFGQSRKDTGRDKNYVLEHLYHVYLKFHLYCSRITLL
jgi:hypothetical protein